MNHEMRRCPNCGAYVMSGDNICPRCDFALDGTPPPEDIDLSALNDAQDAVSALEAASTPETAIPDSPPPDRSLLPTTRLPEAKPAFGWVMDEEKSGPPAAEIPEALQEKTVLAGEDEETPLLVQTAPPEPETPPDQPLDQDAPAPAAKEEAGGTQPHLEQKLALLPKMPGSESETWDESDAAPDAARAPAEVDESEQPTAEYIPDKPQPIAPRSAARSGAALGSAARINPPPEPSASTRPFYLVPPAPYTPPPVRVQVPGPAWITPPAAPLTAPAASFTPPPAPAASLMAYGYAAPLDRLQQRVQAYQHGGYRLRHRTAHEAVLSHGKSLGAVAWFLALVSIIGVLWYALLVALGGFQADKVYITREADGSLFEDGSGAAHIRRQRSRIGRRWGYFGMVIFITCLLLAILLGMVGGIVVSQKRYQAALREAYPAVTLFEEQFTKADARPGDVSQVKNGAVAYAILAGIAVVGLWGGATLVVIGMIHAGAYRTNVPPLPGMR